MGFLTTQDQIGNLSYSSGVITLPVSLLTIGGQQYRVPQQTVNLSGLTAGALYMVFVVMPTPSTFSLVVSTNFNSVGPAGFNKWKLVGAFYSSSTTDVGAFIKSLTSKPTTDTWNFTPTGTWVTNTTYNGRMNVDGGWANIITQVVCSGAPNSTILFVNTPYGLNIDTSKIINDGTNQASTILGHIYVRDFGNSTYPGTLSLQSATSVSPNTFLTSGTRQILDAISQAVPMTFGAQDSVVLNFRVPIVGWSDTPIANL